MSPIAVYINIKLLGLSGVHHTIKLHMRKAFDWQHHSSVKNTCVEEAACVDFYDGNKLSQVVPLVAPQ